ncbi:uncharacterized [Tachysurus ichikawai]
MVAVCSAQVTLDPLSVPSLSLAARVELAPMEFSFVAYLRQINVPSAPSQTGSMDQHFFLSVLAYFRAVASLDTLQLWEFRAIQSLWKNWGRS